MSSYYQNIYKDVKSCISLNGELSNFFMCEKGIRQGENLSPLLFSILLNDVKSNHYLSVETGRWNNTERHERKCTLCNVQCLCYKNCNGVNISYEIDDIVTFVKLLILLYADDTVLMTRDH